MFGTAVSQLRYGMSILLNRRIRPQDLEHIARDMVATLAEFGEPGADSSLLPGQAGQVDPEVRRVLGETIELLDAKGVAQSRITAKRAACLLEESAQIAAEAQAEALAHAQAATIKASQHNQPPAKDTPSARAEVAQQPNGAPH